MNIKDTRQPAPRIMALVKEQDHLIRVYDNQTQTVIGRPPKEERDDQL